MPILYVAVAVAAALAAPGDDFATTVFFVVGVLSSLALARVVARYAAASLPWSAQHRIHLAAIRLGWVDPPDPAGGLGGGSDAPRSGPDGAVTPSRGGSPPRRSA